jgi:cell division protein FtsW (lipid II flippase)
MNTNTMKTYSQSHLKKLTTVCLICLFIPFSIYVMWIYISSLNISHTEKVVYFKNFFPSFLQDKFDVTYVSIFFCIISILLSIVINTRSNTKSWKNLSVVTLILSLVLLLLNLFQLM